MHNFLDAVEDRIFGKNVVQLIAWCMFLGGLIGWPATALTIFSDEPQGVLGLSWLAVIFTGYQVLQQTYTTRVVVQETGKRESPRN